MENILHCIMYDPCWIVSVRNSKKSYVTSLDKEIPVIMNATLCITLNLADQWCGERSVLSGSLKALLRPVAMSTPDVTTVVEISLLSTGLTEVKMLGKKILLNFSSSVSLLRQESHYA